MRKLFYRVSCALSVFALAPLMVAAHGGNETGSAHPTDPHNPNQATSYACGGATASFISGPGKSGFVLSGADHNYDCTNPTVGGAAGALYLTTNVNPIPLTNLSFSLRNGKNGTINVYLITAQAPYPTYSVSFSSIGSADFTVSPSQFNPPLTGNGLIAGVVFDANPCQQVTIKNIAINRVPAVLQVHSSTTCPSIITCQPPNK